MSCLNINKLLSILICPKCKSKIDYNNDFLICQKCFSHYPIIDGIPIMMVEKQEEEKQHDHQVKYFNCHFSKFTEYQLPNWRE